VSRTLAPDTTPVPRKRGLAGDVLVTVLGRGFAPLSAIATAPIMAHALGVDGRGAVAAVTAPLFLATTAATFGVPGAVTYAIARSVALRSVLVRGVLLIVAAGLVATSLVLVMSEWSAAGDPDLAGLIRISAAAVVPSLVVLVLQAVASGRHRWGLVLAERTVTAGVRLVAFALCAAADVLTVEVAVVVLATTPVLGGVVYCALLTRRAPGPDTARAGSITTGSMTSYGLRVWIGSISGVLLSRIDQVLMTPLVGVGALGLYVVAATISEIPRVVSDAARDVTFSADARDRSDERLVRTARLSSAAVVAICALGAANLWWAVPLAFGPGFAAAVPATLVLLVATATGSASSVAGVALIARGHPGARSAAFAASCAVNLGLVLLLVPAWGVMGAAVATVGGSVVLFVLNSCFLWRYLDIAPHRILGLRRGDVDACLAILRSRGGGRR